MQQATRARLDKWLWAARFYRTRTLAKQAVVGGRVRVNGARVKAGRELRTGDRVDLRQGWTEKTVLVVALSEQRRGAPEAVLLYRETEASVRRREQLSELHSLASGSRPRSERKPNKKERRQLLRIREKPS